MSEALLRQLKQLVAELEEQETPRPDYDELSDKELKALTEQVLTNRRAGRRLFAGTRFDRHRRGQGEVRGLLSYDQMSDEELKEAWRERKERARKVGQRLLEP